LKLHESGLVEIPQSRSAEQGEAGAENITALHVDFDRTVPTSGTYAHNDIGIDLDVTSASLGTSSLKGMDIDVVGATSGTSKAYGIDLNVSGADNNVGMQILCEGEQLRLSHNAANNATFTVADTGDLTIETVGDGSTDSDLTLDADGQIKLEPAAGSNILLDGTIAVDAGVVTGATSITSTAFVGTGASTFDQAINKKALHFLYTSNKFTTTTATETYFSLSDADKDQPTGSEYGVGVMSIVPCDGILKHAIINTDSDMSGETWEWRLYRVPSGADADSGGEVLIATVASNVGGAAHTNKVVSFVTGATDTNVISYESGYSATVMFTAGDRVLFSQESNSDVSGSPKVKAVLCFELDESTL